MCPRSSTGRENTAVEVERTKGEMPEVESTLTTNKESAAKWDCSRTSNGSEWEERQKLMEAGDTSKEAGEVKAEWVTVKRKSGKKESTRNSGSVTQIFVKMDSCKKVTQDVTPSDKVSDIMRRIPNNVCWSKGNIFVILGGRVLRWSDDMKTCCIEDGEHFAREAENSRRRSPQEQEAHQTGEDTARTRT